MELVRPAKIAAIVLVPLAIGSVVALGLAVRDYKGADEPPARPAIVTAPPHPKAIAGYSASGELVRETIRVSGTAATVIEGYPVTMNGCAGSMATVRWRSLGGKVTAGVTSFLDPGMTPASMGIDDATTATAGLLIIPDGCSQPCFAGSGDENELTDIVLEIQTWGAAP
jgi:hypothetical protein